MPARIGYVLKGYPRISESFIAQEIHLLEQRGLELEIYAMQRVNDGMVHPVHEAIRATVVYIPEDAFRCGRAWWATLMTLVDFPATAPIALVHAIRTSLFSLKRSTLRRFVQACWLIQERQIGRGGPITHLHSHYVHLPAELTLFVHRITGLTYSISAHAKDIYISTEAEIRERVATSQFLMTCTKFNYHWLRAVVGKTLEHKVHEVYHGVDIRTFAPSPREPGDFPAPRVLSVARLVDKKGYDDVFEALALLKARGLPLHYDIYGGGELEAELRAQARALDISVSFHGMVTQPAVVEAYRAGGVFVLGCREVSSGDRDGIPNSMAEAMSMELAVVATNVSGIPELLDDGRTGLVVPQRNPAKFADAVERLYREPGLARRLGTAAREKVAREFDADRCIGACAHLLLPFATTRRD